ncbi:MAG: hypothetical protein JW837_17105, partial [Sedimentisphaerales bacterium]|nr:hypothetical protein [Sedimentisphaerales bacterium]
MRKKYYLSALVVLLLFSVFARQKTADAQIFEGSLPRAGQLYVPGEFIVKFKSSASEQTINSLNSTNGV